MGKVLGTIGLLIAGAVIGWVVSLILNRATAGISLDASNVATSYNSQSEIVTFDVANTGTKEAQNCTAHLVYNVLKPTSELVRTAPDLPSNGSTTFEVAYDFTTGKSTLGSVWAVCGGSVSKTLGFFASPPLPNQ